jgi:hypothetical protein
MYELLSKMDTMGLIGFVATILGLFLGHVVIVAGIVMNVRLQIRRTELAIAFKRELIERGLTPEEIRTVIEAGSRVSHRPEKGLFMAELEGTS